MAGIETPVRRAARDLIANVYGAFLRVDRGSALYVSDAPRRGAQPDELRRVFDREDFDVVLNRGLLFITPRINWMLRVTEAIYRPEYEDEQARLLARLSGRGAMDFEYALWLDAVKCAEGAPVLPNAFERSIREAAAACLRTGHGGCTLFHTYILYRARLSSI